MDELKRRLSNLQPDSVIYFVMFTEDGAGRRFIPSDALDQIAAAASVPIYGWFKGDLGYGIVGGKLASGEEVAKQTAKLALRVLRGESPEKIPLTKIDVNRLEFDWRQLRRWKIDEDRLPPGASVLYREATFWQRYRGRIIGVATLFALQAALILALLVERRRRRKADVGLKESEERYRNVVDTQTELICRFLPDTTLTFVNDAYCKYFGKTAEELIGTKFILSVPESERAMTLRSFESLVKHPRSETREHPVIRRDGRPGWQQWTNYVISARTGAQVELQGVGRDITERKSAEDALRASEERFTKVFKASPQPMSLSTLDDGRYVYVNDRFLEMSGYRREEVIGRTFAELRTWESPEDRSRVVNQLISSGAIHNLETRFRIKNGEMRVLLSSAELLHFDSEHFVLVASSDITERKQLEQRLMRSKREFSTLVENSPDIISRLDQGLRYIYVSPNLERFSGIAREAFIGKTPSEVALADYDWSGFESSCREVLSKRQTSVREFQYRGRHYRTRIIPEFSFSGRVESVMSITEDFTERLRAELELRQLTARLLSLQDEERRRIARELHDGAAQNVLAIALNLRKLEKLTENQIPQTTLLMSETQELVEQSLTELRTLSYLLHPPILDHAGFVRALQWFVEGFSKRSGIQVDLNVPQDTDRLPLEVETALFRIVQESLTNIRRHSGSETAIIRFEKGNREIKLAISDRGHGMGENGSGGSAGENAVLGVGISGMRQRLLQLGGRLDIESNSNGTTVTAVLPAVQGAGYSRHSSG